MRCNAAYCFELHFCSSEKKFNSLFRHHEFGKTRTSQRSSRPQFGRGRAEVRAEVGAAPSVMPASCPLGRRAIVNSVVSEEDEEEEEID